MSESKKCYLTWLIAILPLEPQLEFPAPFFHRSSITNSTWNFCSLRCNPVRQKIEKTRYQERHIAIFKLKILKQNIQLGSSVSQLKTCQVTRNVQPECFSFCSMCPSSLWLKMPDRAEETDKSLCLNSCSSILLGSICSTRSSSNIFNFRRSVRDGNPFCSFSYKPDSPKVPTSAHRFHVSQYSRLDSIASIDSFFTPGGRCI